MKLATWNSDNPIFERLINEVQPKVIIEIGSWHGGSAIRMAQLAPDATIYCIDTWLGSSEFYNPELMCEDRDLELVDGYPSVYKTFRKNTKKYKNIIPIPLPSHEARHIVPDADLIYIDGSHDFDAVTQDLKDYFLKGKVLFGDDYGNTVFEVKKALDQFCKEKNLQLEVVDDWFWVIRK